MAFVPESHYLQLRQLVAEMPTLPGTKVLSADEYRWLGRATSWLRKAGTAPTLRPCAVALTTLVAFCGTPMRKGSGPSFTAPWRGQTARRARGIARYVRGCRRCFRRPKGCGRHSGASANECPDHRRLHGVVGCGDGPQLAFQEARAHAARPTRCGDWHGRGGVFGTRLDR